MKMNSPKYRRRSPARPLAALLALVAGLGWSQGEPDQPGRMSSPADLGPEVTGPSAVFEAEMADQEPVAAYADLLRRAGDASANTLRGGRARQVYERAVAAVVLINDANGVAAGTLITGSGDILTNWHVVRGNTEVGVAFRTSADKSGKSAPEVRKAKVVKVDEVADLALLRLPLVPESVQPLPLGSEQDIAVGVDVYAIGHPGAQQWTYTRGMVSQIRPGYEWRTDAQVAHRARVIQTQTSIDRGSSGGPLLSEKGTVVGLNSFILSGTGATSFAVSVEEIRRFLQSQGNRAAGPARGSDVVLTSASCKPGEMVAVFSRRMSDGRGTVTGYDSRCTGRVNWELRKPDDRRKPVELANDSNGDGRFDRLVQDLDHDSKWDVSFIDSDFDGAWDTVGHHADGRLIASRYERYADYLRLNQRKTP